MSAERSLSSSLSSDRPELKVFSPADGLSHSITLSQLFEERFVPLWCSGRRLDDKTLKSYRETIQWWTKLTGDPPLAAIDDFLIAKFIDELGRQPGRRGGLLAVITIRRHCRHLQKFFNFAGRKRADRYNRKNQQLLPDPPFVDLPRADKEPPNGDFTLEEIHKLYRAADVMKRPDVPGVRPSEWWRALLVVGYYTSLRRGSLMSLAFKDLLGDYVHSRSAKGRKGSRVYLHPQAREHIDRIRTERELIFPWRNWPKSYRNLNDHFTRLLFAARIPAWRHFKFNGLKKCHLSVLAGQEYDQGIKLAQQSANHTSASITTGHYINESVSERVLRRAINSMPSPVPPGFTSERGRQLELF